MRLWVYIYIVNVCVCEGVSVPECVCVCVHNWALAHLFCENRQSGGWFLTALLQLSCHGTSPPTPMAGNSEASETAQSFRWVSSGIRGQMASEFLLLLLVNCG